MKYLDDCPDCRRERSEKKKLDAELAKERAAIKTAVWETLAGFGISLKRRRMVIDAIDADASRRPRRG